MLDMMKILVIVNVEKQPPQVVCEKKGFLEISQNPQENVCDVCQSLF